MHWWMGDAAAVGRGHHAQLRARADGARHRPDDPREHRRRRHVDRRVRRRRLASVQSSFVTVGNYPGIEVRIYGSEGAIIVRLVEEFGICQTIKTATQGRGRVRRARDPAAVLPGGRHLARAVAVPVLLEPAQRLRHRDPRRRPQRTRATSGRARSCSRRSTPSSAAHRTPSVGRLPATGMMSARSVPRVPQYWREHTPVTTSPSSGRSGSAFRASLAARERPCGAARPDPEQRDPGGHTAARGRPRRGVRGQPHDHPVGDAGTAGRAPDRDRPAPRHHRDPDVGVGRTGGVLRPLHTRIGRGAVDAAGAAARVGGPDGGRTGDDARVRAQVRLRGHGRGRHRPAPAGGGCRRTTR